MNGPKFGREHWRITVPMLALFCAGALLSAATFEPTTDVFQNLWVGGVFGGFAGLGAGTYWHLRDAHRKQQTEPLLFLSLYGAGALFVIFAAIQGGLVATPSWFGVHSADTAAAKRFVRESVGVVLPQGVRAIYLHDGSKATFEIDEVALDATEAAISLDSTWERLPSLGEITFRSIDSTQAGVHEQIYQRWNRLYQLTRFHPD